MGGKGVAKAPMASDMADWEPLKNRLAFSYSQPITEAVDGNRKFDSRLAPFQKFRWIHFPWQPKSGIYRYRATKMHMAKYGAGQVYVNFTGEGGADKVKAAYSDKTYKRLQKVKDRTDPSNLFRFNQNIAPS